MRLANRLVEHYELYNKTIIEIGCGQGEFITTLCELGNNQGIGFDPAYNSIPSRPKHNSRITFIQDLYSEEYANFHADFICCKMTLEHIQNTYEFINMLRRSIGERRDTLVYFQVPDVTRILNEMAFWDIYYEHCSYFSCGSLAHLFRKCGFDIIELKRVYEDQYLMILAKPRNGPISKHFDIENDLEMLSNIVNHFSREIKFIQNQWKSNLLKMKEKNYKVVIWGAGSKGVAFLTTLNVCDEIDYVVDINPRKNLSFMAGTGQLIISPAYLQSYNPDVVIIMNPTYSKEIKQSLDDYSLKPKLIPLSEGAWFDY